MRTNYDTVAVNPSVLHQLVGSYAGKNNRCYLCPCQYICSDWHDDTDPRERTTPLPHPQVCYNRIQTMLRDPNADPNGYVAVTGGEAHIVPTEATQ